MIRHSVPRLPLLGGAALLVALLHSALQAFEFEIDPSTRNASLLFYHETYVPAGFVPIGWTGSQAACDPGATSRAFREAVIDRVNYFRAMAGVPANVVLNEQWSAHAQRAALMMSSNNALSHTPTEAWSCYTAEGALAAGKSNLNLGGHGVAAIHAYMKDFGAINAAVGHRRWILYPQTDEMGTGDVAAISSTLRSANALWVIDDDSRLAPRPETRDPFVAWPPPGFVPYQVTFPRWSFSYPGADFSAASVAMTENGAPVDVALEPIAGGYGENTLVWIPKGLSHNANWARPTTDVRYSVSLSNVVIGGAPQSFVYDVSVFDPDLLFADFDANKRVDDADLAILTGNFGRAAASPAHGDADRDGDVDGNDLILWQREAGIDIALQSSTNVPEPAGYAPLLLVVCFCAMIWRQPPSSSISARRHGV